MLQQYKEAIEKSNIISKTDTEGIITFVNDEFCAISKYSKRELVGQNHNIVRHPDVNAKQFKVLWETIKAKKIYKATVKNRAKDGSTFYVNTTIIPILDKNQKIIEYIAIRYDVTKEVQYKEALDKLNKELEQRVVMQTQQLKQLNETLEIRVQEEIEKNKQKEHVMFWQSRLASLGVMLANIAHQWRQPLTELNLILFSLKNAAFKTDSNLLQKHYQEAQAIIQNMSQTIEDFTNFFQPQKTKHHFNITTSIKEALHLLDKLLTKEMVQLKTEFCDLYILGISNELTQVIINLIQNSIDAFAKNSILIREITICVTSDDEFVYITLSDNGGGIKKEFQERVFEPYFTTKHNAKGTGLGLFMSKMICEQGFNGALELYSKKNITIFTIKIPHHEK